jgi:DeoR family fructose operon transcriptional repressor
LDWIVRYTEAPARRQELIRRLEADGYVSSSRLATEFGVSEMTIRRDLRQLHLAGRASRVVGGASLPEGRGVPFELRNRADAAEKRAIASACAALLTDAATIALDAGTTVAPLAALVPAGAIIVSHSVPVIDACAARDDVGLIGVGGLYQPDTRSFAGPAARSALEQLSVDVAVLSATAVNASGVLCANTLDAEIKRAMAGIAARTVLLADHTKLGARATIRVGALSLVDTLVTDALAPLAVIEELRAAGVEVVVASPDEVETAS